MDKGGALIHMSVHEGRAAAVLWMFVLLRDMFYIVSHSLYLEQGGKKKRNIIFILMESHNVGPINSKFQRPSLHEKWHHRSLT